MSASGGATRYLLARMLLVFIIFWIVVGIVVFLLAMRGGSRKPGEPGAESGWGQRAMTFVIIVMFVFALVVPTIVLAFNAEHKASVAVGGVVLNKDQQKGRELFARACAVCHTLAAVKSVGRIGPNLDVRVGDDVSTATGRRALVLSTIMEGRAIGRGDMPAELYVGKEAEQVADFVAAVAGH
jgi:mono/diheme cytochrome c family protein